MSETLAAKSAELASQVMLLLVLPRALGPSGYGGFAAAFGALSLVSLAFGLGAPLAAMRYVPRAAPAERESLARAVAVHLARSRAWQLTVVTVAATAAAALVPGADVGLVATVCAASWFSVGSSIVSELALSLGRHRVWNARFPLENSLIVAGAVAGHAAFGPSGAIVGMAFATATAFVILAAPVLPRLARAPRGPALPPGAGSYARFETASVMMTTVVLRSSPLVMLLLGASRIQIGYAAIATGVGAAGVGVVLSLMAVHLPTLSDLARSDQRAAEAEAGRYALLALGVAVAAALPAALFAGPILRAALGPGFAGARDALVIALCAPPLGAAIGLASQLASLRLRPAPVTAAWACGAVVFTALAAATIPEIGARGASLAMVGGLAATAVVALGLLRDRPLRAQVLVACTAAVSLLAAGWMGRSF